MKALRYENENLAVADVAKPEVNGEALVRVTLSGIRNTDLEIARGYAGFQGTLGHEFVGIIESMRADGALARHRGPQAGTPLGLGRLGRAPSTEPLLTRGLMAGGWGVGQIYARCGFWELCRSG